MFQVLAAISIRVTTAIGWVAIALAAPTQVERGPSLGGSTRERWGRAVTGLLRGPVCSQPHAPWGQREEEPERSERRDMPNDA
jgi:hypothetical protein